MLISVIVPALNDATNLLVALPRLAVHSDVELIVVDGGSVDRSMDVARQFTPYVFRSTASRGQRLNEGARHATGDILLFLHPDTFLLDGAVDEMQRRIIADGAVGGAFDLHVDTNGALLQLMAKLASARARFWRAPRGNQALFVWRQIFAQIGGFADASLGEEVAFVRRLRRRGRLVLLRSGLLASARPWLRHGVMKTALVHGWLGCLRCAGVPATRLERAHDSWLPPVPRPSATHLFAGGIRPAD